MLLTIGATNKIGIYMTARDENNYSHISLYGGASPTPTVRIGNLTGLPAVNESNPQGWGIYTNNGYFDGVIVSNEGKIGGWTLGADRIWTGNFGVANSAMVSVGTSTAGTDKKQVGGSSAINGWTFTSGTNFGVTKTGALYCNDIHANGGEIGGWSIGTDTNKSLYYGNQTPGATTTNLVLSKSSATNSNAIGGSGTGVNWFISAGKVFGVTTAGALYSASGKIGGWTIGSTALSNGTYGSDNSVFLSTANMA